MIFLQHFIETLSNRYSQVSFWSIDHDERRCPDFAGGLAAAPWDLTRIGMMMLKNGTWKGVRVVPADWILALTSFGKDDDPC